MQRQRRSLFDADLSLSLILRSHVDPHQLNQLLPLDLAVVDRNQRVWKLLVHPTGDRNLILKSFLTAKPYRNSGGGCLHLPLLRATSSATGTPSRHHLAAHQYSGKNCPARPKHAFCTWITASSLELSAKQTAADAQGRTFPVQADHDCAWVLGDKEFGWKLCSLAISSMAT
ncbi:hypothetical protein SASPL_131052 [Salvia splendens]|uniref:Uncharacterized protein n=1 Tax=Salvia splendens TaxID=180675 RepID=A0A8X8X9C3_SALSN|nr:hypothetical protein SASPL_131052 [Salvia splendens]